MSVKKIWITLIFIFTVLTNVILATDCPPLSPPSMALLKCQEVKGSLPLNEPVSFSTPVGVFSNGVILLGGQVLHSDKIFQLSITRQCLATCYNGQVFDTGETVVVRTCDQDSGHWMEGDYLPVCRDTCNKRLLTEYSSEPNPGVVVTASTDVLANDVTPLMDRMLIDNIWGSVWKPEVDDLAQFIQVKLPSPHRINGLVLKGDGISDYVTSFRVLFSQDGETWYPYSDNKSKEKFLGGNRDSNTETTVKLSCPHEATYVRINPITWSRHIALAFDLIGCPVQKQNPNCSPLPPPQGGVINCEVDGDQTFCTAYCEKAKLFRGNKSVISTSCSASGQFDVSSFPPCVDGPSPVVPTRSRPVFCLEQQMDCDNANNGDYQYCGDCHYFSTCSHGNFYVRACPALLQFDAVHKLCDYKSRTCSSLKRRFWLADRRLQSFNSGH